MKVDFEAIPEIPKRELELKPGPACVLHDECGYDEACNDQCEMLICAPDCKSKWPADKPAERPWDKYGECTCHHGMIFMPQEVRV
jgi:hypothetical protein